MPERSRPVSIYIELIDIIVTISEKSILNDTIEAKENIDVEATAKKI